MAERAARRAVVALRALARWHEDRKVGGQIYAEGAVAGVLRRNRVGFPSGQRDQTVNLTA